MIFLQNNILLYISNSNTKNPWKSIPVSNWQCGKNFTTKISLARHKIIHQGTKQKCNECDKEYYSSSGLFAHKQSIHQNRNYPCKVCGKEFRFVRYLTKHRDSVHLGIKFPCSICKKEFSSKANLSTHIKKMHK